MSTYFCALSMMHNTFELSRPARTYSCLFKAPEQELLIAIRAVRGVGCAKTPVGAGQRMAIRLFLVVLMQFIGEQLTVL